MMEYKKTLPQTANKGIVFGVESLLLLLEHLLFLRDSEIGFISKNSFFIF